MDCSEAVLLSLSLSLSLSLAMYIVSLSSSSFGVVGGLCFGTLTVRGIFFYNLKRLLFTLSEYFVVRDNPEVFPLNSPF